MRIVGIILIFSTLIGIVSFYQYKKSERFLTEQMRVALQELPQKHPLDCIDHTIDFVNNCQAMKSLCQASVSRYMGICLSKLEMSEYCTQLGDQDQTTRFGYQACKSRNLKGLPKKACAIAFRTIERHCRNH